MIAFVDGKMSSMASNGSHKVTIGDFDRPVIEVVHALLKDPAKDIEKPPKCSHLVLGNAFINALTALTSQEYGNLVNQKGVEQLENVIKLLDKKECFSDHIFKSIQETAKPNISFVHSLDVAKLHNTDPMVCGLGVICLAYYMSMNYLDESLTDVPMMRGHLSATSGRLPTFLKSNAHMMPSCSRGGKRGESRLHKVFDFERTILQYGKQIVMYKQEGLKSKAAREDNRKKDRSRSQRRARPGNRGMPPAPSRVQAAASSEDQTPLTSSVKRIHDIADELQNLFDSLSNLVGKMTQKLDTDRTFTKRDVEEILHDMQMASVDRMRRSLDEFVEQVDDNFSQQKETALREEYALMNEQSWLGTKLGLKPLPEDPLQMIRVAVSETTKTMKKYNSDDFFNKYVHEIGPLFKDFPSVRLRRRSVSEINKSIRNGEDLRDDLITQLLLTMHHSIAGQEDEDVAGNMGWCSALFKKLTAVLQKKDEPMQAAASSKPKEEEDADSDSYSYTDWDSDEDGAPPKKK